MRRGIPNLLKDGTKHRSGIQVRPDAPTRESNDAVRTNGAERGWSSGAERVEQRTGERRSNGWIRVHDIALTRTDGRRLALLCFASLRWRSLFSFVGGCA